MNSYELTCDFYTTVTAEGLGQNLEYATPKHIRILLHAIFITQICWGVVIWIVKYSVLAFYWRLFSANRRSTRVTIWTLAALVTCWGNSVVRCVLLMMGMLILTVI